MKEKQQKIARTFAAYQLGLGCILLNSFHGLLGLKTYFLVLLLSGIVQNEPVSSVGGILHATFLFLCSACITTVFSFVVVENLRRVSPLLLVFFLFWFTFFISVVKQSNKKLYRAPCNVAFSLLVVNMLSGSRRTTDEEFGAFRPVSYLKVYCIAACITASCNLVLFPYTAAGRVRIKTGVFFRALRRYCRLQTDILSGLAQNGSECTHNREKPQKTSMLGDEARKMERLSEEIAALVEETRSEISFSRVSYYPWKKASGIISDISSSVSRGCFCLREMHHKKKSCFLFEEGFPIERVLSVLGQTGKGAAVVLGLLRGRQPSEEETRLLYDDRVCFPDFSASRELSGVICEVFEELVSDGEYCKEKLGSFCFLYGLLLSGVAVERGLAELERSRACFPDRKALRLPSVFWRRNSDATGGFCRKNTKKRKARNTRYSFLLAFVVSFIALFGVFRDTKEWFMYLKGHWALISVFVVLAPTTGEAVAIGGWRVLGAGAGGVWAAAAWSLCGHSWLLLLFSVPFTVGCLYVNYVSGYRNFGRVSLTTFSSITVRKIAEGVDPSRYVVPVWLLSLQRAVLISIGVVVALSVSVFVGRFFARRKLERRMRRFYRKAAGVFCCFYEECEFVYRFVKKRPAGCFVFSYCRLQKTRRTRSDIGGLRRELGGCAALQPHVAREGCLQGKGDWYAVYLQRCRELLWKMETARDVICHLNSGFFLGGDRREIYDEEVVSVFFRNMVETLFDSYCSFSTGTVFPLRREHAAPEWEAVYARKEREVGPESVSYFFLESLLQDMDTLRVLEKGRFEQF
ncbi:MAG: uncharacterized protein A8A55_1577 [Amphiamblys sp. WSBS2006]|nr:MAG: uncharacterized protein A8A55_1577 [Amphiamblys sp. WSBS2006]